VWSRKKPVSVSNGRQVGMSGMVDTLIAGVRLQQGNK
jgi:hypothetical protein